jgi:hypothetical protein
MQGPTDRVNATWRAAVRIGWAEPISPRLRYCWGEIPKRRRNALVLRRVFRQSLPVRAWWVFEWYGQLVRG